MTIDEEIIAEVERITNTTRDDVQTYCNTLREHVSATMLNVGGALKDLESRNIDLQEKLREDQLARDKQNRLNVRVQNACILHANGGCTMDDAVGTVLMFEKMMEKYK